MDRSSSLGLFSKLSYELREQIWLGFLPSGRDDTSTGGSSKHPKTHLDILRASRFLYHEVSNCLYSNVCLQFELSPFFLEDACLWTTMHFNKIYRRGQGHIETKATWELLTRKQAESRGFYNICLHPQIEVEVNLLAPDPDDSGQLFRLWRKTTRLIEMLKESPEIPRLTIRLQKCEDQDWHRSTANCSIGNPDYKKYDHDVVLCPFYGLQNTKTFIIETHSDELKRSIDWDVINWASEIVSERDAEVSSFTSREHYLARRIAGDYFWIHQNLFFTCEGRAAGLARLVWLSSWFIQDENDRDIVHSEFEDKIVDIIDTFPEIICRYDRNLEALSDMHRVMVLLNHDAMIEQGQSPSWDFPKWQRWVWFKEYEWGIPNGALYNYAPLRRKAFQHYTDIYAEYADHGGFFSRIPKVIREWRSLRIHG